jgi:transposase-like protein
MTGNEEELLSTIAEMKEAGYSYKEISKRTGITPMAVRSRWRRMTGTHLKGSRTASEAASKPGARMRRSTQKPDVKIATQLVAEGVELPDPEESAPIPEVNAKNGWKRLPASSRHVVAHVPNTPNRLSEIRYSICKVPPEALSRIAAHDEYFYYDVPELV